MSLKNNDSQELPIKFTRYERACRPNPQATTCHAMRLPDVCRDLLEHSTNAEPTTDNFRQRTSTGVLDSTKFIDPYDLAPSMPSWRLVIG